MGLAAEEPLLVVERFAWGRRGGNRQRDHRPHFSLLFLRLVVTEIYGDIRPAKVDCLSVTLGRKSDVSSTVMPQIGSIAIPFLLHFKGGLQGYLIPCCNVDKFSSNILR